MQKHYFPVVLIDEFLKFAPNDISGQIFSVCEREKNKIFLEFLKILSKIIIFGMIPVGQKFKSLNDFFKFLERHEAESDGAFEVSKQQLSGNGVDTEIICRCSVSTEGREGGISVRQVCFISFLS